MGFLENLDKNKIQEERTLVDTIEHRQQIAEEVLDKMNSLEEIRIRTRKTNYFEI